MENQLLLPRYIDKRIALKRDNPSEESQFSGRFPSFTEIWILPVQIVLLINSALRTLAAQLFDLFV